MKKTRFYQLAILFAAISLAVVSCKPEPVAEPEDSITVEGITLTDGAVIVNPIPEPLVFTVTSNKNWTLAKTDLAWASVSPMSGTANVATTVTVTVFENPGEQREGKITINYGTSEEPIRIIQKASGSVASILLQNVPDDLEIAVSSEKDDEYTFIVDANRNWELTPANMEWATVTPVSGDADEAIEVTILTTMINDGGDRSGTITITAETAVKTITVVQKERASFPTIVLEDITDNKVRFTPAAGQSAFKVTANYDWTMRETANDWLEVSPKSGKANENVTVTVKPAANAGMSRKVKLDIDVVGEDPDQKLTETVFIIQEPAAGQMWLLLDDDFEWSYLPADTPVNVAKNSGGNGTVYTNAAFMDIYGSSTDPTGIGADILRGYTRYHAIKFGSGSNPGGYTTPLFVEIEDKMDVTATFQALNSDDNTVFMSCPAGTYDALSIETATIGTKWTDDPFQNWYNVTVHITGATSATSLSIISEKKSWFMNNIKVTSYDGSLTSGVEMEPADILACSQGAQSVTNEESKITLTVKHNVDFTVTSSAWITEGSSTESELGSGKQTQIEFTVGGNSGSDREGFITFSSAGGVEETVEVKQLGKPTGGATEFPVRWLVGAEYQDEYIATWKKARFPTTEIAAYNADPGRIFGENSSATIEYYVDEASRLALKTVPENSVSVTVGSSGSTLGAPSVTYVWTNDYFLFNCPVKDLAAGTKVNINFHTQGSNNSPKYWMLEYSDGGTWKPALTTKTVTNPITSETFTYNLSIAASGALEEVDGTVTFADAIPDGYMQIRFRCVTGTGRINGDNWYGDDEKAVPQNQAVRIMQGPDGSFPTISIIQ